MHLKTIPANNSSPQRFRRPLAASAGCGTVPKATGSPVFDYRSGRKFNAWTNPRTWRGAVGVAVVGGLILTSCIEILDHTSVAVHDHSIEASWQ
jgi:hypothetical protein